MAFEQNQQNQFNMNNSLDQVKQFQAELDKATISIGAAELAAEEEQQALRLKNLAAQQKLRIEQIKKQLDLEEESLRELDELRRFASERQYSARKKEIQNELELAKNAEEELAKTRQKHRKQKTSSSTNDIATSSKTSAAKNDYTKATQQNIPNKSSNSQQEATRADIGTTSKARSEQSFSNDAALLDLVDLGHYSFDAISSTFEALRGSISELSENTLNQVTANNGKNTSQDTLDLAGGLLKSIIDANAAEENLQKFKKDGAESEINRRLLLDEEEHKIRKSHAEREASLTMARLASEARATDLKNNKDTYILEARLARENAFYDKRNKLVEEQIAIETEIAWNKAHTDELIAQELHKTRLGYAKEYGEYLQEAGKYAVDQEKFEKNKAKKDNARDKKDATSGITDAIQTGQFSKLFTADNKEAVSKYLGQRTAELEQSYMAKFDRDNPEATEAERAEAKAKAEASSKLTAQFELVADAARDLAQTLNAQTDKIGERQAPIDTRLQGSNVNDKILGSYWKQLARDMNKIGAVNPYFKQEDFASNIEALVNKGISFDIKQRAFLMTIQEKIANTFNVADGTLLRLVRIQQQDTTAGRLGMESALNSFLNSMYETSEYLTDVAASVRGSLEEMQALMEGAAGTEVEFQIQKWMGSLYSVGMSQNAVQDIAQAFGQIASGDISGLTGSGAGNLLIMAANEAGMSIADILQDGLDATETNKLMQAMVNYLAEIAETSNDSRVVQQQLANVYGVKASDLRAATNLASSIEDVSKQDLTYSGMLGQLNKMANSMILRTSTGEMLSNIWDNVQYTMATQMSNDPILYLLPRVATLLEDYAGGIDLPFLNVMGFGVDLNTSVAQLMNVAAMGGSILGALGPMMTGLASAVSGDIMLNLAGINTKNSKIPVIARGSSTPLQNIGGTSLSESGYVGNASGEDVKNATLQDAEDSKKKQMVEAKEEETSDDTVIRSQQAIIDIYNLLEEVAHGSQSLRVRVVSGCGCSGTSGNNENTAEAGYGKNGTDNGNWVLSF